MSEMSKVEEVARSMKAKLANDGVYFRDDGETCLVDGDVDINALARATIATMKKPDANMINAFRQKQESASPIQMEGDWHPYDVDEETAVAIFSFFIDAALKE